MAPYVLAFSLPLLLFPLRKLNRYAYVFALALAWSLFAGLRLGIGGNDYFAYEIFYSTPQYYEPFFRILGRIANAAGMGFHGLLSLVALLIALPSAYVIDKRSGGDPVALLIFGTEWFLYGSFVILRQGIAMGLAFLAYDALEERRYPAFIGFALAAVGFHYSALVLLALSLFVGELGPKRRWLLLGGSFVILLALEGMISAGIQLSSPNILLQRLIVYFIPHSAERLNMLNIAEIAAWFILINRYLAQKEALGRNAYFIYVCFAVLALQDAIFIRFGWYFEIAIVLLLPAILREAWKRRYEGQIVSLGLFLYYAAKIARWLLTNADGLGGFLPYRWILG